MIKWNEFKTTKEDYELISKIVDRCMKEEETDFIWKDVQTASMDLECAFNDVNLDLDKLLKSSHQDFLHDIHGVVFNLDRNTGKIKNCFLPRCTAAQN
jgi:hypothetical protein